MPAISPSHRDLLETPHTVAFATVGADGQPQVTAIWAMLDGDVVRTSPPKGRQKYKNLLAHPQVTLFAIDPQNPFRTLEVRATAEITDDPDLESSSGCCSCTALTSRRSPGRPRNAW